MYPMGAALQESITKRLPEAALRCEVVVMTRAELETVMSLMWLDGCDAAVDLLRQGREQAATMPATPSEGQPC